MSDDGSRPDDRAHNRRERLEDECEERAREAARETAINHELLAGVLSELNEDDQRRLAMRLASLCHGQLSRLRSDYAPDVHALLLHFAYRRALAAERRKEGLA